jgi:hypothetical protein
MAVKLVAMRRNSVDIQVVVIINLVAWLAALPGDNLAEVKGNLAVP